MLALKKHKEWSDQFETIWPVYLNMTCNPIQKTGTGNINYILHYEYSTRDIDYFLIGINSYGLVTPDKIKNYIKDCQKFKNNIEKMYLKIGKMPIFYNIYTSNYQLTSDAKKLANVIPDFIFIKENKNIILIDKLREYIIRKADLMELDLDI